MASVVNPQGETLFTGTIIECEQFIENEHKHDPVGVESGEYSIGASEEEDAEYQRNPSPRAP